MGQSSVVNTATTFWLEIPQLEPGATNQSYFVDIAQCLSIINRRSYRQGMNYAVQGITAYTGGSGQALLASHLPTTWVSDNAITKAFETWKDQRAEVLKDSPTLKAKWSDFKVYMDSEHSHLGVASNLTPICFDTSVVPIAKNPYLIGEWNASQLAIPMDGGAGGSAATPEVTLHVVGDNLPAGQFTPGLTTSAGLITAYAQSRSIILAPDPDQPAGSNLSLYNELASHDELSEQVLNNVANANDEPPYDKDNYPGGAGNAVDNHVIDIMYFNDFGDATVTKEDHIGSFVAPMGLIRFDAFEGDPNGNFMVKVDIAPGSYKGVLAERGV